MKIGIPGGLLYYTYEPFIKTFFQELGVETCYSVRTDKEILNLGSANCVDEACLPIKIFHGHAAKLKQSCDAIFVPRIMNCEYGESICPKFEGLPELIASGLRPGPVVGCGGCGPAGSGGLDDGRVSGECRLVFTEPIRMENRRRLLKSLQKGGRQLGISDESVQRAMNAGLENQRNTSRGMMEDGYRHRVFLAGHAYNIYDSFANMELIDKLHSLDIGVVTEEWVSGYEKAKGLDGLIKEPYWLFFIQNFGAAQALMRESMIDGIVYVSSFCCGTDSFTVDMLKSRIGDFPMLVLKLDEQSGEAGYFTRLEAFAEILERRESMGRRTMREENA